MTEDENQVIKKLKDQAEAGDKEAMHTLAYVYHEGEGTEKNLKQFFYWVKKAAEAGVPKAMHSLACAYHEGVGTEKDLKQYFSWMKKAVEAGVSKSMYTLAIAYYEGEGTEKDLKQFFSWVKKAAEAGVPGSMHTLAMAYHEGEGTEKDLKQFFSWVKKAAEAGIPKAMYNLSYSYHKGVGTEKDLKQFFSWVQKAAEAGVPKAMFNLALAYIDGGGTEKNLEKYFQWMEKAHRFKASHALICFPCTLLLKRKLLDKDKHDKVIVVLCNLKQKCDEILKGRHRVCQQKVLSHFTKFAAINSILENKCSNHLRLYNITYFNDPLEGMSLPESFGPSIRKCIYGDKDPILHEIEVGEKSFSVYACAFTEEEDHINMWRAYGNDGDGYSITSMIPKRMRADEELGFMGKLSPSQDVQSKPSEPDVSKDNGKIHVYKVLYGGKEAKKTYKDLKNSLKELQDLLKKIRDEKASQTIKNLAVQILAELRYLYKDEPYGSEQEYRIIDVVDAGSEELECDYTSEPPRLYTKTAPFLFNNEGCKITIGPRVKDKDGAEVYIKHQLHKNDWSETTEVVPSKINYR